MQSATVTELAALVGGEVRGDGRVLISGLNSLADAGPRDLSFIISPKYAAQWATSGAAAAIVSKKLETAVADAASAPRPLIIVRDAEAGMNRLLEYFAIPEPQPEPGVHGSAVVAPTAMLGKNVRIGPWVTVGDNCVIGDDVVLHAGARLYDAVEIGAGSVIHANTVIRSRCHIGRGVILHQNVSIGADGFGYRPAPDGSGLVKVHHIGNVVIGDHVEIGANSCVDRAKFGSTIVGEGTKIDNLVQIAHNCKIGRSCVIAGLTGLAGSVVVGDGVMIGGQAAIADHTTLGSGCRIGACAGVMNDVPAGETWLGLPAKPAQTALRVEASIRKLPGLLRRLAGLLPPEDR